MFIKTKRMKVIVTNFVLVLMLLAVFTSSSTAMEKQENMTIREIDYTFNGKEIESAQSILYNGRAYLPIKFLSENLGYNVEWDGVSYKIGISQPSLKESNLAPTLDPGKWAPATHKRLQHLIDENGIKSPNYDPLKKPYAVFDWDQTSIFNDTAEELFRYQINNLLFKMTPQEFAIAIRKDIPSDNFHEDYNNLDGEPVNIDKLGADLDARYNYLYDNYVGFNGDKSLEEIRKTEEFIDFRGKLAYLYEAIGGTFSANVSYPWVLYMFTGMTSQEVWAIAEQSNDVALGEKLELYTLTSSEALPGEAGVVTGQYKRGLRIAPEMSNLMNVLRANGIDVYICTASLDDVVRVFANNPKYGYNVPMENVIGMRLEKNQDGTYKTEYKNDYPQTQQEGKTVAIKQELVSKYGYGPIFIASDSQGDYYMATDFEETQLVLIINRVRSLSDKITLLAQKAIETMGEPNAQYVLQGRNENVGQFLPQEATIRYGKTAAELIRQ